MIFCTPGYKEKTIRLLLDINRKLDDLTHSYIKYQCPLNTIGTVKEFEELNEKNERWKWKNQENRKVIKNNSINRYDQTMVISKQLKCVAISKKHAQSFENIWVISAYMLMINMFFVCFQNIFFQFSYFQLRSYINLVVSITGTRLKKFYMWSLRMI